MSDSSSLHRAVAAESKAWLTVNVLRVANIRAIVALVDGHVYPCTFGVRLQEKESAFDIKGRVQRKSQEYAGGDSCKHQQAVLQFRVKWF